MIMIKTTSLPPQVQKTFLFHSVVPAHSWFGRNSPHCMLSYNFPIIITKQKIITKQQEYVIRLARFLVMSNRALQFPLHKFDKKYETLKENYICKPFSLYCLFVLEHFMT